MKVQSILCGQPVNESERRAHAHLRSRLLSAPGDDEWLLLSNLSFSSSHGRQSDEIDFVVIGPPGARVVEVKHWGTRWINRQRHIVEREAEKVTAKAKRIGAALRRKVRRVGRVDGAFLITERASRVRGIAGRKVRNIPFCTLGQWKEAIGFELPAILSRNQVRRLGQELALHAPIALEGKVRRLFEYEDLQLQTPRDQRFHRIFKGVRLGTRDPMVVHLYDLSAKEGDAEVRARREYEALYRLSKFAWAPRIRASFQELRDYPGEMWFFSIDDPAVPSLEKRAADKSETDHFAQNERREPEPDGHGDRQRGGHAEKEIRASPPDDEQERDQQN